MRDAVMAVAPNRMVLGLAPSGPAGRGFVLSSPRHAAAYGYRLTDRQVVPAHCRDPLPQ